MAPPADVRLKNSAASSRCVLKMARRRASNQECTAAAVGARQSKQAAAAAARGGRNKAGTLRIDVPSLWSSRCRRDRPQERARRLGSLQEASGRPTCLGKASHLRSSDANGCCSPFCIAAGWAWGSFLPALYRCMAPLQGSQTTICVRCKRDQGEKRRGSTRRPPPPSAAAAQACAAWGLRETSCQPSTVAGHTPFQGTCCHISCCRHQAALRPAVPRT